MPQPYSLEQDLLNRKTVYLNAFKEGRDIDEATVNRLLGITNTWPDIGPGASLSFARAGLGPDHPVVKDAAKLSVQRNLSQQEWSQALKSIQTLKDVQHLPHNFVDSLTPDEARQYQEKVWGIVKSDFGGSGPLGSIASDVGDVASSAWDAVAKNVESGGNFQTGKLIPGVSSNEAKGAVRTAGLVAQTPVQYVQAKTRDIASGISELAQGNTAPLNPVSSYNLARPQGDVNQTQGGQAAMAAMEGRPVDIGAGLLPDPNSQTGQAAAQAAREAAPTIAGHAFTLGRGAAYGLGQASQQLFGTNVVQPGSNAFNIISGGVDAVAMIKGDPSAALLAGLGDARQAGRVFTPEDVAVSNAATEHAGLLPLAAPPEVVQPTKTAWLNSNDGDHLLNGIVDEGQGSASNILRYFRGRIDTQLASDLAAQGSDRDALRQVLQDATLPEKPQVGGFIYQVQKTLDNRVATMMPNHTIVDLEDKNGTWVQLERTLASTNMPVAQRNTILDQYLASKNPIEAMDSFQNAVRQLVVHGGMNEAAAAKVASVWRDTEDLSHAYDVDQATGLERQRPGVVVNGEGYVHPAPTADSERLSSMVRLPNARTLREVTSKPIFNNPVVRGTQGFLDGLVNGYKTAVVMRPALLTKITLEEQINAAARGQVNMFTDGARFLSVVAGGNMDNRFGQLLARAPGVEPSYLFSANGQPMLEDSQNLLQRTLRQAGQDPDTFVTIGYHNAPVSHPGAPEGLVDALTNMHTDPIFRNIANMTPDEAKAWFWGERSSIVGDAEGRLVQEVTGKPYEGIEPGTVRLFRGEQMNGEIGLLRHGETWVPSFEEARAAARGGHVYSVDIPAEGAGGWAGNFDQSHINPIVEAQQAGRGFPSTSSDDYFESLGSQREGVPVEGSGRDIRLGRAPIAANDDAHNLAKVASGEMGPNAQAVLIGDLANDRAAADRYIDEAHFARINDIVNGNQELRDAISTGKLGGHSLYQLPADHGTVANPPAVAYANELLASGEGPRNMIPVRDVFEVPGKPTGWYSKKLDTIFHYMVDAPNKALNASPAFRQLEWERTIQLLPYVKPADYDGIVSAAESANLPETVLDRVRNVKFDTTDTPRLSADEITDAAKRTVLGYDLPKQVHDLTSRSHLFDMLRYLVPFGDAWRLVLTRAAKLVADEPQILQRLNAAMYEAKQPGSAAINRLGGDPVNGNQGFIHTDPLTGEQVFTIPGSTLLTKATFGVPVPLVGQVKGLSMASDAYPFLGGPGISLPAKWLLPDTPAGNTLKDVIFPNSSPESQGPAEDIWQQFAPSWFRKLTQSFPNTHTFNSAFNAAAQSLASTGSYNLNDPQDLQKLIHDAKQNAKWIYTVRGAAQFLLPGAPTSETLIEDKTGRWANAEAAVKAYQKRSAEQGPDKAMKWLVDTLGVNNVLVSQSASQPTAYAAPVTKPAQQWVDANPSVASDYPLVYGLFTPAHPGDKFDLNAYEEQFSKGQRQSLTPEQQVAQAENRLGFFAYDRVKNQVIAQNGGRPPDKPQRDWLAAYRKKLGTYFPGFDTFAAAPYNTTKRRASAIQQLQAAAKDPIVQKTEAGQGLIAYLDARQQAINQAVAGGGTTPFQAKAGQPLRYWLRAQAAQIIQDHPDFKPMWDDLFSREMTDN